MGRKKKLYGYFMRPIQEICSRDDLDMAKKGNLKTEKRSRISIDGN